MKATKKNRGFSRAEATTLAAAEVPPPPGMNPRPDLLAALAAKPTDAPADIELNRELHADDRLLSPRGQAYPEWTVGQLFTALRGLPADARVVLACDREGTRCAPLYIVDVDGIDWPSSKLGHVELGGDDLAVVLYPLV